MLQTVDQSSFEDQPIIRAVKHESTTIESFDRLIKNGVNVHVISGQCLQTPVFYAVQHKDENAAIHFVDKLVSMGCQANITDYLGQTCLFYACKTNRPKVVAHLLSAHGLLADHADTRQQTPLFFAASWGAIECMEILVQYGANIDQADHLHQTALFFAASYGRLPSIKWLIEHGADPAHRDYTVSKKTAEWFAKNHGHPDIAEYLSKATGVSSVNKRNSVDKVSGKDPKLPYKLYKSDGTPASSTDIQEFERLYPDCVQWQPEDPEVTYDFWEYKEYSDWNRMATNLLRDLWKSETSQPFRLPVVPNEQSCPNYFNIIKTPMDLYTVKRKLNNHQYPSAAPLLADLDLIFTNCSTYNTGVEHPVRKAGEQLSDVLEELLLTRYRSLQ
eukprot:Platyproteum_vivax@DN6013_c0_g1_i1.p1